MAPASYYYSSYDYPSSQPPSPPKSSFLRSSSPLHLSIPLCHSTSSRYSPSSRASDSSRLLDPSYAPHRNSIASSSAAYVDHHGDLHDPDYRDFPAVVIPTPRRPSSSDPDADDASSDDEAPASVYSTYPASIASNRRASSIRRREALARDLAHPYRPPYPLDSPSASCGSGDDSPLYDDDSVPFYEEKESRRWAKKRGSRRSALLRVQEPVEEEPTEEQSAYRTSAFAEDPSGASKEMNSSSNKETADDSYVPTQPSSSEWAPSCGHSLRRRWQVVALRFRFTIFRAKRRVRRRFRGA